MMEVEEKKRETKGAGRRGRWTKATNTLEHFGPGENNLPFREYIGITKHKYGLVIAAFFEFCILSIILL